jgi:hypothetical protein
MGVSPVSQLCSGGFQPPLLSTQNDWRLEATTTNHVKRTGASAQTAKAVSRRRYLLPFFCFPIFCLLFLGQHYLRGFLMKSSEFDVAGGGGFHSFDCFVKFGFGFFFVAFCP